MSKILEFYIGKTVLITGATGYIGRVLLEKILSTMTDIERIYLLLRPKRGLTPQERAEKLLSNPIFTLNKITKAQKDKVFVINSDISKVGLDLSEEDRNKIINEVDIVLHVAASIYFHLELEDSLMINTMSTKTLMELCTQIKNLKSVVHVSTAFSNVDKDISEEKIYDFKNIDANELLEQLKIKGKLNAIQTDMIQPHPNTYIFSKRLAELVVRDFREKLPISIVRPSFVGPSYKKPIPGWIDNIAGIMGLALICGTGAVKVVYCKPECYPETTPVDCVSNLIIASSWYRTWKRNENILVFNLTQMPEKKRNFVDIVNVALREIYQNPLGIMIWYPKMSLSANYYYFLFMAILHHFLPALIIDGFLIVFRRKPIMVKIQKKVWKGQKLLLYFASNNFQFDTKQMQKLYDELDAEDKRIFFGIHGFEMNADYLKKSISCANKYIFKDDGKSQQKYVLLNVLFVLDKLVQVLTLYGALWLILYVFGMTKVLTLSYWSEYE